MYICNMQVLSCTISASKSIHVDWGSLNSGNVSGPKLSHRWVLTPVRIVCWIRGNTLEQQMYN